MIFMKKEKFTIITKQLTLFAVLFLFCQLSVAQIVGYSLTTGTSPNLPATTGNSYNFPALGRVMTFDGLTNSSINGTNGWTCYGWNSVGTDSWKTNAFSTEGYINISGSCQMKANTSFGPKNFKIQYSLNGSSWSDVLTGNDIVLTNGLLTYNFTLPNTCENKTTVYLRWVLDSTTRLDGGTLVATTSTHNASLKGVTIAGDAFAAPSTQASEISIIAVTPTTIKVGCTNGNGNNRIIVIRKDQNFDLSLIVDDYFPTANTNYVGGTEQQVIFVGAGSQTTVTVDNATDEFWFRIFDFNKMDALTRYNTDEGASNPKQCKLETINSPTDDNIRLTRATLGGTISTPSSGTITERGIFWSTTSPVDETSNIVSVLTDQGGLFTIPDIDVTRGTTIYYKAYVTNLLGTMMSDESSFTNVPTFTGTGVWEDPTKWNVQEVPGANGDATYGSIDDSPIIEGNCTLGATNQVTNLTISSTGVLTTNAALEVGNDLAVVGELTTNATLDVVNDLAVDGIVTTNANLNVTNNLTINSGGNVTVNASDIGAGNQLKVDGTLTNDAGTSGLLLKSGVGKANGTLIWAAGTPTASVEMYSLASKPTDFKWQYFGIPVTSLSLSTVGGPSPVAGSYVRKMNESNVPAHWEPLTNNSIMYNFTGYEITRTVAHTYTFPGTLVHTDYVSDELAYTTGAHRAGQHLIGNSFTAAIYIPSIVFGAGDIDEAVTLYTTGSSAQWLTGGQGASTTNPGPGQYVNVPIGSAISMGLTEIPSMQAFIVKVNSSNTQNTVTIPLTALVTNTTAQRAPAAKKPFSRISVTSDSIYSDIMWLISDANSTHGYENGYDGKKYISDDTDAPQLYAKEVSGNYQVNSVNDFNNTNLGFVAGKNENYTFTFTNENLEMDYPALYLYDRETNDVVDITTSGTQYSFTATPNSTATNRFKILTSPDLTTGGMLVAGDVLKVYSADNQIIVENGSKSNATFNLFDISGRIITTKLIGANSTTQINANLKSGIYVSKTTISDSGLELISKIHLK